MQIKICKCLIISVIVIELLTCIAFADYTIRSHYEREIEENINVMTELIGGNNVNARISGR